VIRAQPPKWHCKLDVFLWGPRLDGPRLGQYVEGHGSEVKADFARLAEHVRAEMAVVKLVAHRLGVDTRGPLSRAVLGCSSSKTIANAKNDDAPIAHAAPTI
jgi:hypothetical protein